MRKVENNVIIFDSLADIHKEVSANPDITHDIGSPDFYGHTTKAQGISMLVDGDQSQIEKAKRLVEQFDVQIETHGSAMGNSVAGFAPCVPEYLGGSPESMYCMVDCESPLSPLKIIVDPTSSAGVSTEVLNKRGAVILAAAMALSAMRPISLEIACCVDCGSEYRLPSGAIFSAMRVQINSAPLDLGSACYALSNPAFPRRICYGILRGHYRAPLIWPSVPGVDMHNTRDQRTTEATLRLLGEDPDQCLFIPAIRLTDPLVEEPKKWISKTLAKYGQPALA